MKSNGYGRSSVEAQYLRKLKRNLPAVRAHRSAHGASLSIFPNFSEMPFFIEKSRYQALIRQLNVVMSLTKMIAEDLSVSESGIASLRDPLIGSLSKYRALLTAPLKTSIARPDVLFTEDGFKVVELNVSSSVGGYVASEVAREYFESHPAMQALKADGTFKFDFKPFGTLFPQQLSKANSGNEIVLWDVMTFPLESLKDQSVIEVWMKILSPYFKVHKLGGFPHRENFGQQLNSLKALGKGTSLFRIFHPSLIDLKDQNYAKVLRLLRDNILQEVSDLSEVVWSNKILLSHVSMYADLLLKQPAIDKLHDLLPQTFELISGASAQSMNEHFVKTKTNWVLKKGGSYASRDVFFGHGTPLNTWKNYLHEAASEGGWIVQQYHRPKRMDDVILATDGDLKLIEREVEIGPYLVNGKDCGIFCRARNFAGKSSVMSSTAGIVYEKGS